jgi:hypothetical protein
MTSSFTHKISREETNFRQVLHIQALVMQKTILNKIEYSPFQGWY